MTTAAGSLETLLEELDGLVPELWVLDLHRVIPADAAAPERQRTGWKAIACDPVRRFETLMEGWGRGPREAALALTTAIRGTRP